MKAFVEIGSSSWDALLVYYSFIILVPTLGHSYWWHGDMNAATKSSLICKWYFSGKRPFQQKTLFISAEGKKERRKQQQKHKNQPWKWCKFEKIIKLQVYVLCSVVTPFNSKETGLWDSTGRHISRFDFGNGKSMESLLLAKIPTFCILSFFFWVARCLVISIQGYLLNSRRWCLRLGYSIVSQVYLSWDQRC